MYTCLFFSDVPDVSDVPAEADIADDTEKKKEFKTSGDVAFYRCVGHSTSKFAFQDLFHYDVCVHCVLLKMIYCHFLRRQMQGPNLQHRALLDTMVLTEKGACFQLLESDSQV